MGSSPFSNLCFNNSQQILLNNSNQIEIIDPYIKASVVNLRDSIKSIYIMKVILSYIISRRKYQLIIYNKNFQKKLKLDLEDYKRESGKYKIGEKTGKGIEYELDSNIKIFEGEYLNGKKHGKGKEYYNNGKIKFEGEYLNGYKIKGKGYDIFNNEILIIENNGKGKEYYDNGKIQYEGEYFNGKRWNGISYNYKGEKEYEIKNGKGYLNIYNYNGILIYIFFSYL